jgi:hypothetical protein
MRRSAPCVAAANFPFPSAAGLRGRRETWADVLIARDTDFVWSIHGNSEKSRNQISRHWSLGDGKCYGPARDSPERKERIVRQRILLPRTIV